MRQREPATCVLTIFTGLLLCSYSANAIGCFVCTSLNRGNSGCEDTFNNTGKYYRSDCKASRDGRMGMFPATQCIKMVAEDTDAGFSLIVRDCVVDNGGTTSETEIGRQSHCGWMKVIKYNGRRMSGCILSCGQDGCNMASWSRHISVVTVMLVFIITKTLC
ncbi:uncharacterized protein LOC134252879 [Saccostrea cucullata]|uniref:uncharacterized protein LOC134252879 n=1 Tax=Saccostrea cuccullata TaxID=36930 RepID=UPI002ECFBA7C